MSEVFIEGLGTTVVGMLTVFAVLIVLSFVLYLLKFVNKDAKKVEIVETVEPKDLPVEPTVQEEADALELIAVITAAIALSLNADSDKLQIKSIVKVNNWNTVARKEQQRNIF